MNGARNDIQGSKYRKQHQGMAAGDVQYEDSGAREVRQAAISSRMGKIQQHNPTLTLAGYSSSMCGSWTAGPTWTNRLATHTLTALGVE